jgi:hypothetical protein
MADAIETQQVICGTCVHFRRNPQTIGAGVCWCLPPSVIPVSQGGVAGVLPVRPPVRVSDSCGQWLAAASVPFKSLQQPESPNG